MQKSIIILLVFICNLNFGQGKNDTTESQILDFKSEMKKENISDFFIVKHITHGSVIIPESDDLNPCYPKETYYGLYAFWKKEKKTYIKKFDNCSEFKIIKLNDSKVIDFFKDNLDKIKLEEVEEYTFKPDSIVNGRKYSFISTRSHSPLRYFWFYNNSTEFKKNFDKFQLQTEKDNENLNFESNNNLSLVKLNLFCEKIIAGLAERKRFKKIK